MALNGELSCISEGEAAEPYICHGLLGGQCMYKCLGYGWPFGCVVSDSDSPQGIPSFGALILPLALTSVVRRMPQAASAYRMDMHSLRAEIR